MGLSLATLNGSRVTSARLSLPAWGRWQAEVSVDGEVALDGAVTLVLADLTLKGTILSGGPFNGRSFYRVVAGGGGWGRELKSESYANDAGVKLSTVLGDAASAVGEHLAPISATRRVGPAFVRPQGPAAQVLEQLAEGAWYIDESGVTTLGRRPPVPLAVKVTIESVDRDRRVVRLATDTIASILPGVVIEGIESLDVEHVVSQGGIRSTVWGAHGATGGSRELAALRAVFEQLDPNRAFRGVYEYRVALLDGKRLSLQPVRVSTGMPNLQRVPVRPGVAGCETTLALGSRVLVGFVDADPVRPVVLGFEEPDGAAFLPTITEIDAIAFVRLGAGAIPVARAGDLAGGIWPIVPTQTKVVA